LIVHFVGRNTPAASQFSAMVIDSQDHIYLFNPSVGGTFDDVSLHAAGAFQPLFSKTGV